MKITDILRPFVGQILKAPDRYHTSNLWTDLKNEYHFVRVAKGEFILKEKKDILPVHKRRPRMTISKYGDIYHASFPTKESLKLPDQISYIVVPKEETIELWPFAGGGCFGFHLRSKRLTCSKRDFVKTMFKNLEVPFTNNKRMRITIEMEIKEDNKITLYPKTISQ
jgi:hypothetical protein